jgi:tetratricopeptide (TPR) repeat protein
MRRSAAILGAAAALAAGLGAVPARLWAAEPPPAQEADRQALAQGLQAQYEAALIRERKMADDRETQLIGSLEARLRTARVQADAAKGDARQANATLDAARADYETLVGQVVRHDPTAQADVLALRSQAQSVAAQASPAKVAALQRFADGDRTGAWPQLQSITQAEMDAPGASIATQARDLRELASLRDVMRAHGEAGTADVLSLYDKAAVLDPSHFRTELERARLAHDLGDLPRARGAAELAGKVAVTDNERADALKWIAEQATAQHDYPIAGADYVQSLAIFRRLAASDPTPSMQNNVAMVLQDQGDLDVLTGDFKGAKASYAEGLGIRQKLSAADPASVRLADEVASFFQRIGDLDEKLGDVAGARSDYEQGLAIRQRLAAADPTNNDLAYYASAFMRRIGDLALKQGDLAGARKAYEDCLAIRQRLSAANPSSAQLQNAVALDFEDLAQVAYTQGDLGAARTDLTRSLDIRVKLGAADPTNAAVQQLILRAMTRLARIPNGGVAWDQVAAQYRKIKDAGQLVPGDDKVLEALRAHGQAAGL